MSLHVGRQTYVIAAKLSVTEYQAVLTNSVHHPVLVATIGDRAYWLFNGKWFWDNDSMTPDQVYAMLITREQRRQAQINRAQATVAMSQSPTPTVRGAIPDDVKHLVWTRDQGCCRKCGSNVELQFDHVIPVSMGGASTPENLQILCGPCNRRKGASII
ncbi:HNH endonuclease [Nocardia sp. NPDC058058]|uniref:HNH endonuclease n=1 Tax=Nocardia sp. NPDC058058 TaxID=3346317 RepID=UPI0036D81D5A